eukprot:SAG22_NODE_185_length_15941_cov_8.668034_10_plen_214_part_00
MQPAPTEEEKAKLAAEKANDAATLAAEEARAAAEAKARLEVRPAACCCMLHAAACCMLHAVGHPTPAAIEIFYRLLTAACRPAGCLCVTHQELKSKEQAEKEAASQAELAAATTEQAKAAAGRQLAKDKLTVKAGAVKGRKIPKGALDLSNPELEDAWQKVSRDDDETDWAVFQLAGDMATLKLVETGDDGLEGMCDELDEAKVQFGYVRNGA